MRGKHENMQETYTAIRRILMELKAADGTPSRAQNDFLRAVLDNGYYACICYGWHTAADVMYQYVLAPEGLKEATTK